MGVPSITLLKEKPFEPYECNMCGKVSKKNKFLWKSWFTGDEINICRDCAYKESYGTVGMKTAKQKRLLEEKEINQ
jgi:ribosome-binding protein aMBF1 (putative translation factor)